MKRKSYFPISVILEKETSLFPMNNNLLSNVNSYTCLFVPQILQSTSPTEMTEVLTSCVTIKYDKLLTPLTRSLQRCLITNHNVSTMTTASAMDNEVNEGECILESVVYYVDPKSPGSLGFLGGKECIRIPVLSAHSSFEAFKRHIIEHAGLKTEAEKRGLRPCIDLKLCRLVKTQEGSKAYSINTQAQWDAERPLFVSSAVLQGGYIIL